MGLRAKSTGGKDFDPTPAGLHLAVCYAIFDLGTHYSEMYNNSSRKLVILWELPNERIDIDKDGEKVSMPRAAIEFYTLSLNEKSRLRHHLESWRSQTFKPEELEGFELENLLGVPCQLQIIHNQKGEKIYANVSTIVQAPKGTKLEPENKVTFFSFDDGTDIPENTPEWIQNKIKESDEWRARQIQTEMPQDKNEDQTAKEAQAQTEVTEEDDLPF